MKKNFFFTSLIGAALMLLATLQSASQTIQFEGGSCVFDTIVETKGGVSGRSVRVDFKYTLDENATLTDMKTLLDKGQFVAGRTKFKANGIVFDVDNAEEMKTKKNGTISLTVFIPAKIKMESVKFVFNKQTVSLKN
ncbi:MAG: hypothetical protein LBE11_08225 [Prevotellaceae bacterium]|jgi:hypothetical protein|nr:hypothetical protein [Prevotellaceae bacterium]